MTEYPTIKLLECKDKLEKSFEKMSSLTKLKKIDDNTKFCIFGFTRNHERKLKITIPMMIQYLFMIYYWIEEKFTVHGDYIDLDETNTIATCSKISSQYKYNTAYGNGVIDINDSSIIKYKWTFKILRTFHGGSTPICIGIDSSYNRCINNDFSSDRDNQDLYYSIGSNYCTFSSEDLSSPLIPNDTECTWFHDGDVVDMILDVKARELRLAKDQAILIFAKRMNFSKVKKYNLAVAMRRDEDMQPMRKLQLVNFETFHK